MFTYASRSTRSTLRSPRCQSHLSSLLVAPLVALTLLSAGCGTPVIKVDTTPCNRAELTKRPAPLPDLTEQQAQDPKELTRNHLAATKEFHSLKQRHAGLSECVEENSR